MYICMLYMAFDQQMVIFRHFIMDIFLINMLSKTFHTLHYVPTNHLYIGDIFLVNSAEIIRPNLSIREGIGWFLALFLRLPLLLLSREKKINVYYSNSFE